MNVRLPDGTVIQDVPDGTTQLELERRLVRAGMRESLNPQGLTDLSRGFLANLPETGEENILRSAGEMQKRGMFGDIVRQVVGTPTHEKQEKKEQAVPRSYLNSLSALLGDLEEQGLQDTQQYQKTLAEFDQAVALDKAEEKPGFKEMIQGAARMAVEDPGALAAGFVTGVAEDPILALTPLGYRAGATKAVEAGAGRAAQIAAGMGTAGATGAATMAPISAMEQLDVAGRIDPGQVAAESALAGVATGVLGPLFAGRPRARTAPEPEAPQAPTPEAAPTAEDIINRVYGDVLKEPEPVTPTTPALPAPVQRQALPAPKTFPQLIDQRFTDIDARLATAKDDLIKQSQMDEMWAKHEKIETPEDIQITRDALDGSDPRYLAHVNEMNETRAAIEAAKGRPKNTVMEDALRGVEATKVTDKDLAVRLKDQNSAKQLDQILKQHNLKTTGNKQQKAERIVAFNKQRGGMSPEMAAFMGAAATGAGIGALVNPGLEGAGVGALMGVLAAGTGKALVKASQKAAHRLAKPHNEIRITDNLTEWDANLATHQRETMQIREALRSEIPDPERDAITHYMEGDTSVEISDKGKKWADNLRKVFDEMHRIAKDEGVIESYWENYVPHIWQIKTTPNDLFDALTGHAVKYGRGMSSKTMHSKERLIPTLAVGKDLGLTPKTEDIADLVKIYGDAVYRAIMNKRLREQLGKLNDPGTGKPLIMKAEDAPATYVDIPGSPHFMGMRVHPDIEPSLRFVYKANSPGEIMRGISALNFASKRMLVSGSFFHANALLESMLYAGINPLNWTKGKIKKSKVIPGGLPSNARRSIDMLRHGKAGDVVDTALRAGLKIGTIEDVGNDVFYSGLKQLEDALDRSILGKPIGAVVKGFEGINRFVDKIMWDTIMTGGKLTVFAKEYEKALLKHKNVPKEVLAQEVAGYVNDAFGGQNWLRMAEAVQGRFVRRNVQAALSPTGRQWMQLALFAPDWTTSNLKILSKALPGINKNDRTRKLHRAYFRRGALFALIGGSIVQSLIQGKPSTLLENPDVTTVDLGDGRKMTWSKQFFEPYHWAVDPAKTAMNKMGSMPRAVLEQGINRKWISPYGAPKIVQNPSNIATTSFLTGDLPTRIMHLGGKFVPIAAQQTFNYGPAAGLAGFLGHPIYKQSWKDEK